MVGSVIWRCQGIFFRYPDLKFLFASEVSLWSNGKAIMEGQAVRWIQPSGGLGKRTGLLSGGLYLNQWETFYYVVTGKRFTNGYIKEERQGNHLGSIDLGVEFRMSSLKFMLYRQSVYEVGGLAHLANIQDGLNGLSIENLRQGAGNDIWQKFLIEFLYTKIRQESLVSRIWLTVRALFQSWTVSTGWSYNGLA